MSKVIQVAVSDKSYEKVKELILANDFVDYEGNYIKKVSKVYAYLSDLGLRVHLSSKNENHFNINEYRYELYKKELQSLQLCKALIEILNELPNFSGRTLIDEFFNKNIKSISWIETEMDKFFSKDD
jgi:hypothetical protein